MPARTPTSIRPMRIGVVIPTLDEEALIGRTLRGLRRRGEAAVVVVA